MPAGVYIHIPFCRSRCSYCDFATGMFESGLAGRYVQAVTKEFSRWSAIANPESVDTIYFGGGTPSLLSPAQITQLFEAINHQFNVDSASEITLEINPASILSASSMSGSGEDKVDELSDQKLREFRRLGINRASFGAQTFDDRELKQLGRSHTAGDIPTTFAHLREAGFENINFDLIAGLPGQTLDGWKTNVERALALRPEHLSLYLLDVHEGTPLADQISRGARPQPDPDLAAEMYLSMVEQVSVAGYEHYEISNFCLPGFQSRHNTRYWTGASYYGFGCSAHSYDGVGRRWANERDVMRYVETMEADESPILEFTDLDEEDRRSEAVFLGLRMMQGLELSTYRSRFGADLREAYKNELERLNEAGLIVLSDELLRLTTRGALLSNEVFAALA